MSKEALSFIKVKSTTEVQPFDSASLDFSESGGARPTTASQGVKWEPAPVFRVSHLSFSLSFFLRALPLQSFIPDEHVKFIPRDGPVCLFILTLHLACSVPLPPQA